jgi:hypothetical protein
MNNKHCLCRKCGYQFDPAGRFVDCCPKCKATKWSYSATESAMLGPTEHLKTRDERASVPFLMT